MLSGTATSTSILKNLVLPGIGHFTILDSALVSNEDAGNNFFLEGPESIGKPRASEAVRLLRELNDSVDGAVELSVRPYKFYKITTQFTSSSVRIYRLHYRKVHLTSRISAL